MITKSVIAKHVVVSKDNTDILKDISFMIPSGTLTGLIGPSGSGKTTLMRALVGVQRLTSGALTIEDAPAGHPSLRARVGYVSQSPAVYNDLTVLQNVEYFASLLSLDSREAHKVIHEVDLSSQRKQLVSTLSGGERARVSLAIALLGNPDVLILDEPTVGLDPLLRQKLWHIFATLAKHGRTLLVSSHVMDEADRCDDVILMREGRLIYHGTRKELLKKAHARSVEAAFISLVEKK